MRRLLWSRPRGQGGWPALPLLLLLLLLASHAARTQNWRNENFERPIDLEGSGDDDSFEDEEMEEAEEFYSGSGSGYFEQESGFKTVVRVATDAPVLLTTTSAVMPITSVQPVGTPFVQYPTEEATSSPATASSFYIPRMTEAPAVTLQKGVGTTTATTVQDVTTTTTTTTITTTTTTTATTTASTTSTTSKPTTDEKVLEPFITIVATTQSVTLETPSAATAAETEAATDPAATTSTAEIGAMPNPSPTQEPESSEKSTVPPTVATESVQGKPQDATPSTAANNELEVPVSGDFEIREEEETAARTELTGPVLRKNAEPGLIDNTIESSNSAAQLPQKNILERKEVLIAVIVGGVVGALFAAFLVMLLIYRMKKKDEGSYTLEEPKQASVTYQKPDKQEEFYA
ncbi:hypothetical protein JRQ81_011757 [Phrynocephalus forsythii]|uniref:Syndecan n=1 Tax=Phrynocephalus forsythii TaxID=171643 RepID=A0A9Q0X8G0_9SAUR|nr:hypothetical protein JRQ81_011757 [Phrynocephalus forsythii]